MKIIAVAFLVVIAFGYNEGQDFVQTAAIQAVRGVCRMLSLVDRNLVKQVRNGTFTSDDMALKKYCFCVYRSLTIMDDNANVDVEKSLKIMPTRTDPEKFKSAVANCKDVTGTSTEDKAYQFLKCYNVQYPKDIIAL